MVKWDLWWTKWRRGRFSPSTSVSPAIHSTKFSIPTITRGRYNRPVSGRRAEWTQFGLHLPTMQIRKKLINSLPILVVHPMVTAVIADIGDNGQPSILRYINVYCI
jgi:hypothetical protein